MSLSRTPHEQFGFFSRVISKLTHSLPLGSPFGLLELCSSQSIPRSPDHLVFYFCCELLRHSGAQLLRYGIYIPGSALRGSLHFISISEFGKNSKSNFSEKVGSKRLFTHHPLGALGSLGSLVPLGIVMSAIVCLSGCSSLTDATESAVGAGAGAAAAGGIGYAASHGNLLTTAMSGLGGAAGGGLLTSLFQSRTKKQKVEETQKGYDQGKSDTVKSLYWVARSIQKPSDEPNELKDQFLQVTQEGRPDANIGSLPYEVTLPVQI